MAIVSVIVIEIILVFSSNGNGKGSGWIIVFFWVKKLVKELKVDLVIIVGIGFYGRIVVVDIESVVGKFVIVFIVVFSVLVFKIFFVFILRVIFIFSVFVG